MCVGWHRGVAKAPWWSLVFRTAENEDRMSNLPGCQSSIGVDPVHTIYPYVPNGVFFS